MRGMVASDRQSDPTVDNAQLRRSYARDGDDEDDEDESGRPEQRMKRRNSFNKMQQQMGDESLEAAEVVASQVGLDSIASLVYSLRHTNAWRVLLSHTDARTRTEQQCQNARPNGYELCASKVKQLFLYNLLTNRMHNPGDAPEFAAALDLADTCTGRIHVVSGLGVKAGRSIRKIPADRRQLLG